MAAKESGGVAGDTASLPTAQEVKESYGTGGSAASLPEAQEASLAGQYREMDINCSEMDIIAGETAEEEEVEISAFVARFASQRRREERLAVIAADLSRMKEKRGSSAPTFIELAAFVLLRESAAAALEGLPSTLSVRSLFG